MPITKAHRKNNHNLKKTYFTLLANQDSESISIVKKKRAIFFKYSQFFDDHDSLFFL